MKANNFDIKANGLFNAVGYVKELGDYAGRYSQEAYEALEIEGELENDEWCDLMVADNGKIYAVAGDSEATQSGNFYFKEIEFCDLPESAKSIVADKMLDEFEDDVESQLHEIAQAACNGLQGWYIPIIAKIEEDNRIRLYAGSTVSRGTQLISNDAREMCVGMMETWTPTYERDDAERWARDCNTDPADFDYDEEVSNDILYNLDYSSDIEQVIYNLREWLID